ncbi:MAG: ABC transporter substrate-binding protein [Deltaproteobacteria bacterium]
METRNRNVVLAAAVGLLLAAVPGAARAVPGPAGQIRATIDNVIEILKRPDLKSGARSEQRRELLRRQIAPAFDFEEMSKRSLGLEWRNRTPEEREAFVRLFTQLLENAYLGKIESYRGETISYLRETIDPPYGVVHTVVVTSRGQEIPIDYRMLQEGDRWRIYDLTIEGVSLVGNYRSQFNAILRKSSFPEMMDRLRDTIRKQES